MPCPVLPPTRPLRIATLLALGLSLACFKPDDDPDPMADGDSGESETAGECPIATDGCPCTAGDGCDKGLECNAGLCGPIQAVCGNGKVEGDELCDDGNTDNTDSCTTACAPPSCDDGLTSGDEVDVDCGHEACGIGCNFGQACLSVDDCAFPSCGPAPDGESSVCELPTSCAHWLMHNPDSTDNIYKIDPDGAAGPIAPMDVYCHMGKNGGGWTLVFVASDDGVDTWTWNNRSKLAGEAEPVGSLQARNLDFMSPAYRHLPFTDLLFIHEPSWVWAHYADVGDGTTSISQFIAALGNEPICDFDNPGYPLAAGSTLSKGGLLCETNLYFNLGDHENGPNNIDQCMDLGTSGNEAAFGPVWNGNNGDGCPFDDPAQFGLGPHAPCTNCPGFAAIEFDYLGFGHALDLNSGAKKAGENYMQMYVR